MFGSDYYVPRIRELIDAIALGKYSTLCRSSCTELGLLTFILAGYYLYIILAVVRHTAISTVHYSAETPALYSQAFRD